MLLQLLGGSKCTIVAAIGGGGDIVSAIILGEMIKAEGGRVVYASILWERFVHDKQPGPIRVEELAHYTSFGSSVFLLPGCYAVRDMSGVIIPAACKAARIIGEPIAVLDAYRGVNGVRRSIEEISKLYSCDAVIGVDVGGDVLAEGWEEELWSPLADSIGLAGVATSTLPKKLVAIHSPGSDGELPRKRVLERIAEIAESRGFLGVIGVSLLVESLLENLVKNIETEASKPALLAIKGYIGTLIIRGGTRKIEVDPCSTTTFLLDAEKTFEKSPIAKAVANTTSIWEAKKALNALGVYTELDLELDLLYNQRVLENPLELIKMHREMKNYYLNQLSNKATTHSQIERKKT